MFFDISSKNLSHKGTPIKTPENNMHKETISIFIVYFQNIWINNIITESNKQNVVFAFIDSWKTKYESVVKIIVPIENPINLDGHISPLYEITIYLTLVTNK